MGLYRDCIPVFPIKNQYITGTSELLFKVGLCSLPLHGCAREGLSGLVCLSMHAMLTDSK